MRRWLINISKITCASSTEKSAPGMQISVSGESVLNIGGLTENPDDHLSQSICPVCKQ
jgi:hypothetical protein